MSLQDRIELKRGDSIEVSVSQYPLPTICRASAACLVAVKLTEIFYFMIVDIKHYLPCMNKSIYMYA